MLHVQVPCGLTQVPPTPQSTTKHNRHITTIDALARLCVAYQREVRPHHRHSCELHGASMWRNTVQQRAIARHGVGSAFCPLELTCLDCGNATLLSTVYELSPVVSASPKQTAAISVLSDRRKSKAVVCIFVECFWGAAVCLLARSVSRDSSVSAVGYRDVSFTHLIPSFRIAPAAPGPRAAGGA